MWNAVGIVLAITFGISVVATLFIQVFAHFFDIVDVPGGRKKHHQPTPLLGGAGVIVAFIIGCILMWPFLTKGYLLPKHLIGLFIASGVILIGGVLDDKYNLSPLKQIAFPIVAALVVVASGIGVEYITNPFGGTFDLASIEWTVFTYNNLPYSITVFADLLTLCWLMGTTYTTKFLDGLDGLVAGVTIIGAVIIAILSQQQDVFQPETAALALIIAAAFAGFLVFNWHPARIFLGESGSVFAGFIIGVLAIISGSKIATTLLIIGIPLLDLIWVIIKRIFIHKTSPVKADRTHLHMQLVDSGLSTRQAVLLLYLLTASFGASSLFLTSEDKLFALVAMVVTMIIIVAVVLKRVHQSRKG